MAKLDPCNLICVHPNEINPGKVREISESIRSQDWLSNSKIQVYYLDGKYIVVDGNHRAIAACKRGIYPIPHEEVRRHQFYTDSELRDVLSKPITIGQIADSI